MSQSAADRLASTFAERTSRILFWVGAGLSNDAGVPSWVELRRRLTDELEQRGSQKGSEGEQDIRRATGIRAIENHWKAFGELQTALGRASYAAAVRQHLSPSEESPIPPIYSDLWRIRPAGIVSLNLDGLCYRAAGSSETEPHNFVGTQTASWLHVLKQPKPFLIQLHGRTEDVDSWILTEAELGRLQGTEAYRSLIPILFGSFTVVFIGVSADDAAAGGLLYNAVRQNLDLGEHYWVTDRRDARTNTWAEEAGIQAIYYDSSRGHTTALRSLIAQFAAHRTREVDASPVVGHQSRTYPSVESPTDLASKHPEEIRQVLAGMARSLISEGDAPDSDSEKKYVELCQTYRRAIHNTWYVSNEPPDNVLFGYTVLGPAGPDGGFGRVYRAESRDGIPVAIKLLKQEVFENKSMLDAYRRGVRSLKILSNRKVDGVVGFIDAFELPPALVMEYIEGTNLELAVRRGLLDLEHRLAVISRVAEIVLAGHRLPERVLHRDIRPANILIPDGQDIRSIYLIDFDLSYHRGALEKSVDSRHLSAFAYLAPEQLDITRRVSTRHSAVDSFGLGMTAFFALTGQDPRPGAASLPQWEKEIQTALGGAGLFRGCAFKSTERRAARVIYGCTRTEQSRRHDFGVVSGQFNLLNEMIHKSSMADIAEVWSEELFAVAFGSDGYEWDEDRLSAVVDNGTGATYRAIAHEDESAISVEIRWQNTGARKWNDLTKQIAQIAEKAARLLGEASWEVRDATGAQYQIRIEAKISVERIKGNIDRHVRAIREIQALLARL